MHFVLDQAVESYEVSLEKQEVFVTGTIPYDDLLAKIKKTGKEVGRQRLSLLTAAVDCLGLIGSIGRDGRVIRPRHAVLEIS